MPPKSAVAVAETPVSSTVVGTLHASTPIAVAATADLDTKWKQAQAARGAWVLDIVSTNHAALPPSDLRDVVGGLLRGKEVVVLEDGTVRAFTASDLDTRNAETNIVRALAPRELSGFVKFSKATDHTPGKIVADAARCDTVKIADIEGAKALALPAGSYEVATSTDAAGRLVVTLTRK